MSEGTLTKKVDGNVFPANGVEALANFIAAVGKNFTLEGFDSEESAKETAEHIVGVIRNSFGKHYDCSVAADGREYNLNCRLVS